MTFITSKLKIRTSCALEGTEYCDTQAKHFKLYNRALRESHIDRVCVFWPIGDRKEKASMSENKEMHRKLWSSKRMV
jgi:hypothetical protein